MNFNEFLPWQVICQHKLLMNDKLKINII